MYALRPPPACPRPPAHVYCTYGVHTVAYGHRQTHRRSKRDSKYQSTKVCSMMNIPNLQYVFTYDHCCKLTLFVLL